MMINAYTEDSFMGHKGNDLHDPEKSHFKSFRVKKSATIKEALELMADQLGYPLSGVRLWPISARANETNRPTALHFDSSPSKPISEWAENNNPWCVFLELNDPDSGLSALPPFDKDSKSIKKSFDTLLNFI